MSPKSKLWACFHQNEALGGGGAESDEPQKSFDQGEVAILFILEDNCENYCTSQIQTWLGGLYVSLRRRERGMLEMKTTRKLILLLARILEVFSTYIPAVTSPEKEGVSYKDGCSQASSIVVSVLDGLITGRISCKCCHLSVCLF